MRQITVLALLCRLTQILSPMASCNVQELLDEAACFATLKPGERDIVQLQLLCNINSTIINALPICGQGNPNTNGVVGTVCGQLYLDTDSDTYYVWNSAQNWWA